MIKYEPRILSLCRNEFNKFNNTRARILDSIYHMILKLLKIRFFGVKTSRVCNFVLNVIMDVITIRYLVCKPLATSGLSILFAWRHITQGATSCDN